MTITPVARPVRPRQQAPDLTVPLLDGGTFRLADRRPERFTMVVFNRGLHCPVCQAQLRELDRRLDELTERGIEVVSVSGETRERAQRMHDEWKLERVRIAYGLREDQMRAWGLFISRGISDDEPALFNEPALYLIDPDGAVYYASVLSMPAGRPRLDDLLGGIDYWHSTDYPARGEA
jgi:peroxiredoxin